MFIRKTGVISKNNIVKNMENMIKNVFIVNKSNIKVLDNVITGGIDIYYGQIHSPDIIKSYTKDDLHDGSLMTNFMELLNDLKSKPITRFGNRAVFYGVLFGACYRYLILDELEINDNSDKRYYIALDKVHNSVSIIQIDYRNKVVSYEGEVVCLYAPLINPDDIHLKNEKLCIDRINNFFKHFQFEISELLIHYREKGLPFKRFSKDILTLIKPSNEEYDVKYVISKDDLKEDVTLLINRVFDTELPDMYHDTYGITIANGDNMYIEVIDDEDSCNENINQYIDSIFIINSASTTKLMDEARTGSLKASSLFSFIDNVIEQYEINKI